VAERAAGHQKTATIHRPDERVGGIDGSRSSRNSADGQGCDEFGFKPGEFNRLVASFDGFWRGAISGFGRHMVVEGQPDLDEFLKNAVMV